MVIRATVLLALLLSGPVSAQNADPANVAKAQAYVDLSGTLFKSKDFAGALDALRKAEPLLTGDPSQSVARFNIARCLEELGRPVESAAAYDLYLSQPDEARRQARARDALARLTTTSVATLAVRCTPAAVEFRLGDGPERACPAEIRLAAGSTVVHASAPRFVPRDYPTAVVAGKRSELVVALSPTPPVVVMPTPSARAPSSRESAPASAGPTIAATEPIATSPETPPSRVVPYSLLGAGGLSMGAGVVFHLLASSKRDEAGQEQYGSKRDSLTSDFETLRTVAYIGYGVGLVSAGIGAYLLLDARSEQSPATSGLSPNGFWVIW